MDALPIASGIVAICYLFDKNVGKEMLMPSAKYVELILWISILSAAIHDFKS